MENLSGSIERITFYNPENGYTVLRLRPEHGRTPGTNRDGLVTAIGNFPELVPGEHVTLSGEWANHPKHGMQFQVEVYKQTMPATVAAIRRYLSSGLVRGIGPRLADRIVAAFGLETLQVIEQEPERLREVPDIGPKRSRLIAAAWQEQRQIQEIMLFLHSHGISTGLAIKIYREYGEQSLQIVQTDPYRLARDLYGVGFKTADKIARELGLPFDHPSRIEAGLIYTLNQATDDGHVFVPRELLIQQATELLEISPELLPAGLERLRTDERVHEQAVPLNSTGESSRQPASRITETRVTYAGQAPDEPKAPANQASSSLAVYLSPLYFGELGTAERLRGLAGAFPTRLSSLPVAFIQLDPGLSEEQKEALRRALSQPVSVLTGGPGTGKTTALKALISALEEGHKTYALASPTGRAAKRLSQATGRQASTIHRLLGFKPGEGFKVNAENPLDVDMLVVDETSMLDILLANNLFKALKPGTHLLLVGDVDQLPSVGAGDVLREIIRSELAPVTRLSVIFRQAADSHIITNAHRINTGQMPVFPGSVEGGGDPGDCFLFPAETPEEAANWVQEIVCQRIPQKFGYHPLHEIQVLAPMYRGSAGVTALNERLQNTLNPGSLMKPEKRLFGQVFRPGDKVMQTLNNYDKEVYNGDIGFVFAIDAINHTLTIDFEGRALAFDWSEADQLILAYAVSVHKAQGSEFPAVVIPMITQHYMMLQRNLLYTAMTRARNLCVLVGSRKAIAIAVHNDRVTRRYTALGWRLRDSL
jgi:exodeoxyribonuclease V alpha subunit